MVHHQTSASYFLRIYLNKDFEVHMTSLLQGGITLPCSSENVAEFLLTLPDFTLDYLADRVQTILLNGDAVDDLEISFSPGKNTIALSAAMPGLAGAILRRNSLCSALRKTAGGRPESDPDNASIEVKIKLFNMIAQEKGGPLLRQGGIIESVLIYDYFQNRPGLLAKLDKIELDKEEIPQDQFFRQLPIESPVHIKIITN